MSQQTRECDHPTPANGGSFCIGERARYKTCSIDPCPENEPGYRAQQCSRRNNKVIKGKTYTWFPYLDFHDSCKLYCTDKDDTLIHAFDTAEDGTSCNTGTNDMCIGGICKVRMILDYAIMNYTILSFSVSDAIGWSTQTRPKINAEFVVATAKLATQ